MFRGIALGLALFLLTAPPHLWAGSCAVVAPVKTVAAVNYVAPVGHVVPPVAYVPFLPAVTVPSYTVTYVPPPVVAPEPAPVRESIRASDLAEILAEIKALRGEVDSLKRSQQTPPQAIRQRDGTPDLSRAYGRGYDVMVKRCLGCHEASVADEKGGGTALADKWGMPVFGRATALKSAARVSRHQMPPPPDRLSPGDVQAFVKFTQEVAPIGDD